MEVVEADALGVELVEVGSSLDGVAVAAKVAVALVVGYDQDHVRLFVFLRVIV